MSTVSPKTFLGIGKTLFNSSAAIIKETEKSCDIELLLSERLLRKKASGAWPEKALQILDKKWQLGKLTETLIAENRDVATPQEIENYYNKQFPFFENLQAKGLEKFTQQFNPKIKWLSHHFCHANAAHMMSPFEKSLIVVMDGAGSNLKDFPEDHPERKWGPANFDPSLRYLEECSIYLQDGKDLNCVEKNWQVFKQSETAPDHWLSEGLGSLYEKSAEFIFNDKRAAGKVMGLAAFGRVFPIKSRSQFLESIDWSLAFKGKSKKDWENSAHYSVYCDVAASVQSHFEQSVLTMVRNLNKKFPEYKNLILMGGCALNCTTNMKIHDLGIFDQLYVPPFPGDESIGFGAASALYFQEKNARSPRNWEIQNGYFGAVDSIPDSKRIEEMFQGFNLIKPDSIEAFAAERISRGQVIGWYQGRSETGPRALGNRSILARVDRAGIKDYLNSVVKMRENFRPYGCSVAFEKAHHYFEIPEGFENPFMSFAVKTKPELRNLLNEVTHFDGTSRMQTVRSTQNPQYYKLLKEIEKLTDFPCVLNTSLNVMGQPIVESLEDAKNFLLKTEVAGLAIGDYFIEKPRSAHD